MRVILKFIFGLLFLKRMNDQFEIEQIDGTENLINKFKKLKKGLMQKLLTKGIGHSEFKNTEVDEIPVELEVKI